MPPAPMDPLPPNWALVADVARTLLLLGIPVLLKWASDIRADVRAQSERLKGVETWAESHDERDDERFQQLRETVFRGRR